eukprot:COSAG06_NODE_138_length_22354_cov_4.715704_4_plen_70_part_00
MAERDLGENEELRARDARVSDGPGNGRVVVVAVREVEATASEAFAGAERDPDRGGPPRVSQSLRGRAGA